VPDDHVAAGFRRLFTPIEIGAVTIRNRIASTTHGTRLSEQRELRYLQERARGGVGLMGLSASAGVASYTAGPTPAVPAPDWDRVPLSPVSPAGIAYFDEQVIPALRRRAEVIHAEGAACFGQIYHLGGAPHAARMFPPLAPSAVADPYDAMVPHPLDGEQIEELIIAFAEGVRRVRDAGLDLAEIHAAHGYLVHQFLSPYFNRRTDRWGGSLENRLRFLRGMIAAARERVGDFPIGVRLGVDAAADGRGLDRDGVVEVCRALASTVDYISVSGGNYAGFGAGFETAYVSPPYREPAFNAAVAAAVKREVTVPVIVTGRVTDASTAEGLLAGGTADLVGMVRSLIADPHLPRKVRSGQADRVRPCLGVSECHHIGPDRTPVQCAMNAAAGREAELEISRAPHSKTVVVVGAGPAGLEAARVARLRGHTVYLCDRRSELGGTVAVLGRDENRRTFRDLAAYFSDELRRLKVELMLGNEVGAAELAGFAPDAVVVATGGRTLLPAAVDSLRRPAHVYDAMDVLAGRVSVRGRAVVVGGLDTHLAGPTVAEYLSDRGVEVEFISEQIDFARGAEDGTRLTVLHRLSTKGVPVLLHHALIAVTGDGAVLADTFAAQQTPRPATAVVLACGLEPDDSLFAQLAGAVDERYLVGDALAPRRIVHATLDGARAAGQILVSAARPWPARRGGRRALQPAWSRQRGTTGRASSRRRGRPWPAVASAPARPRRSGASRRSAAARRPRTDPGQ
jgi:2,4-dienoyl-CoA reductase-like NADH-dependent reductase (Old Yellow Enzyme family)/thioredoxin reductase